MANDGQMRALIPPLAGYGDAALAGYGDAAPAASLRHQVSGKPTP
jgi:hypothetical protein